MYLDTDCVLALIKEKDWLKEFVLERIEDESSLMTSMISILECRLVLSREDNRSKSIDLVEMIKKFKMELIPYDVETENKARSLLSKYSFLNIFDSLHLATAILNDERILSTDHLFPEVTEVVCIDPRFDQERS